MTFDRANRIKMLDKHDSDYNIREQCELLNLNRTSLYYKPVPVSETKLAVTKRIDKIYTEDPSFGGRTIGTILRCEGFSISDPAVRKYMAEMGLYAIYPGPNLSKRVHESAVYPYLLRDLEVTHRNQVWGTDITYIPLKNSWLYLVAFMDWYSRYVLSWELSDSLEVGFAMEALENARSLLYQKSSTLTKAASLLLKSTHRFCWLLM